MLKEEQAAELLERCERIVGRRLAKVRGDLRNPELRASAIWELLVIESAAGLGRTEYEGAGGGPDVRLELPSGRWVWIEAAYLYPRFWREDHLSRVVERWIRDLAHALGPGAPTIACSFNGDRGNPAGPVRKLPDEHERARFVSNAQVVAFFADVRSNPAIPHAVTLAEYTVTLQAFPLSARGRHSGGGGLVQEVPRTVKEHAVYRVLRGKRAQHNVAGPRLVCVGSDVSPALQLHSPGGGSISVEQAVSSMFNNTGALSGVLVFKIEQRWNRLLDGPGPEAKGIFYINPKAREPLTKAEQTHLLSLDLNRWKITFPLGKIETANRHRERRVFGPLRYSPTARGTVKLTVPAPILMDALAGKGALLDSYRRDSALDKDDPVARCLKDGWRIVGCSFEPGDIERAEAASVVLELAHPHDPVFWPKGT